MPAQAEWRDCAHPCQRLPEGALQFVFSQGAAAVATVHGYQHVLGRTPTIPEVQEGERTYFAVGADYSRIPAYLVDTAEFSGRYGYP